MKQYLEQSNNSGAHGDVVTTEELPEKGLAKSLLAKWKSMENVKDKETSPEPKDYTKSGSKDKSRAISKDRQTSPTGSNASNTNSDDCLPQSGTAKNLLNKWQNIDSNTSNQTKERKGPRPITPPPLEELERNKSDSQEILDSVQSKQPYQDEELALLKGHAKNTLAK
jgi:hypothetical protein